MEGTTVLSNFNLTIEGGGCAAQGGSGHVVTKVFTVTVTDGALNVDANASAGSAVLNAIQLRPLP